MRDHWSAVLPGPAASQGSKRIGRSRAGKPILLDASRGLQPWRNALRGQMATCRPPSPLDCAVAVTIHVHVKRPLAHYRTGKFAGWLRADLPDVPPHGRDVDKIARGVLDAGTGVWWVDDSRVARLLVARFYADDRGERTEVAVEVME